MKRIGTGKVQDKLINQLDRQEKQKAFQRDRFFKFKIQEINRALLQELLMNKILETDNPTAVSKVLFEGLRKTQRSNEFDFKYFIAPIRNLVPRANPISLYMTQYILEVVLNDPNVIDVYGTDLDIYKVVNQVVTSTNKKFSRAEEEIIQQLARNKSLVPGSRDYDVALEEMFRKKMGDPQTT
jgi:hypothetical protein